jgi:hypothetical protein
MEVHSHGLDFIEMGVAGDGKKGLDKEWQGAAELAKSKVMSAKNAWGKTTGYADSLIEQGVEATRAQQLENWRNQQEVRSERLQHRWLTDEFDKKPDEDWRSLSTFGGEQVQDVNLDQELGEVTPGPITGTIELNTRINRAEVFEFSLKVCSKIHPSIAFFPERRGRTDHVFVGLDLPTLWFF